MEISPCPSSCRIVSRSSSLSETGNNAERHLRVRSCVASEKDRLVDCLAERLCECFNDRSQEIDVGIFNVRLAESEVTADLEAVHGPVIEDQIKLVEELAAFCPDCFRSSAHDRLTSFAADLLDSYTVIQFGVVCNVLAEQRKDFLSDCETCIGDCTLFADRGTILAEHALNRFTVKDCRTLFCCEVLEDTRCSSVHDFTLLSFFRLIFRSRFRFFFCRLVFLLCFEFSEFSFSLIDLTFEIFFFFFGFLHRLVMFAALLKECIDLFGYHLLVFVRDCLVNLVDSSFQFSLACVELSGLVPEFFKCRLHRLAGLFQLVEFLPQQKCFKHFRLPLSSAFPES